MPLTSGKSRPASAFLNIPEFANIRAIDVNIHKSIVNNNNN